MVSDETRATLHRLKRRIGRERARANRLELIAYKNHNSVARERAMGEANVLSLTIGFIDEELRKLPPTQADLAAMEPCDKGTDSYEDLDYSCVLGPRHKGLCDDGNGNKRDRRKRAPRT